MHGKKHVFPLVSVVLLAAVHLCWAASCVKTGPCSCRMDDGSGVIDLRPLVDGSPTYKDIKSSYIPDSWVYSYNPCVPFSEGSCKNVSLERAGMNCSEGWELPKSYLPLLRTESGEVCAKDRLHQRKYESYGTQESAEFKSNTAGVGLVLGYVDSPSLRVGAVELWCVERNQPQNFTVAGRHPVFPNTVVAHYYCLLIFHIGVDLAGESLWSSGPRGDPVHQPKNPQQEKKLEEHPPPEEHKQTAPPSQSKTATAREESLKTPPLLPKACSADTPELPTTPAPETAVAHYYCLLIFHIGVDLAGESLWSSGPRGDPVHQPKNPQQEKKLEEHPPPEEHKQTAPPSQSKTATAREESLKTPPLLPKACSADTPELPTTPAPETAIMALFSPCCCPGAGPNCADSATL
ncbi:Hypp2144 [Branchiostoma lanceolatum]|uniref:Hypp2144 protein n=1 Tax=Branchiostoma lanceolatum TaxID=7740 RepID=A0A8J9ZRY9_BRALA|nr:Hypp2144 [Branchiostoma lanceolatum]